MKNNAFTKLVSIILTIVLIPISIANASLPVAKQKIDRKDLLRNFRDSEYKLRQVLVKYKKGVSSQTANNIKRKVGVQGTQRLIRNDSNKEIFVYKLRKGISVKNAVKELRADPNVAIAEPNYIYKASFTPNDSLFNQQWFLNNGNDLDIDAPEAWDSISGLTEKVNVAVIDSGIDSSHPDLTSNLWENSGEINNGSDNIDNDLNGYVDDFNGINWASISQYEASDILFFGSDSPDPYYSQVAQSFTGNGGTIKSAVLGIIKFGLPSNGIKVSLRTSLSGPDLAYFNIAASDISDEGSWIQNNFSSPYKTINGATYYLVLTTNVKDYDNSYGLAFSNNEGFGNSPFPNGFLNLNASMDQSENDLAFELIFDGLNGTGGLPVDDNSHGTHVSGIIGANTNNSQGVAGVAGYPSNIVRIMPLRVLDTEGSGYLEDIIDAIYYAADNGADVINMSLGGEASSILFQDAINYAHDVKGVVIVAAVGNEAQDGNPMEYPAGYNNVIGVGATDNNDQIASFSNHNSSVDVSAPGVGILSTTPTYANYDSYYGVSLNYDSYSGTSMATPVVSGVAALVAAKNPGFSASQIEQAIINSAEDKSVLGRDDYYGSGRVNLDYALNGKPASPIPPALPVPPAPPTPIAPPVVAPSAPLPVPAPAITPTLPTPAPAIVPAPPAQAPALVPVKKKDKKKQKKKRKKKNKNKNKNNKKSSKNKKKLVKKKKTAKKKK